MAVLRCWGLAASETGVQSSEPYATDADADVVNDLDWVLTHWVHYTVCRFVCVTYMCVFFILHIIRIIVRRWGGPRGIEA